MNQSLSRRYFFFGSLALGFTSIGCAHRSQALSSKGRSYPVSVLKAANYSIELEDIVRRVLIEHAVAVRGKRVLLKPNLVEFNPYKPINTHPAFVAAVAGAFRALGAAEVRIAEGPGHRRTTLDMAEAAGYFAAIAQFESKFTDLNLDAVRKVKLKQPFSTLHELYLPETALGCDLLVSLPKLKTHHWAGATLSMKNLFGLVPGAVYGWPKNILHYAGINESVADLHNLFPRQFAIVDGIEGMQGNGPIEGYVKHSGVIIAGAHPPSVDATCCRIMGIAPEKIKYLKLVAARSGWPIEGVVERGESVESVRSRFDLIGDLEFLRG